MLNILYIYSISTKQGEKALFKCQIEPSKPIICPTHVHRINRYVAVPRYYPTHSTSEETVCPGQTAQGFQGNVGQGPNMNMNNFNM